MVVIHVSALNTYPTYTSPAKPVAVVVAEGHESVAMLSDLLNGRGGEHAHTHETLDAGMLLDVQLGDPGNGFHASRILEAAGCPEVMNQIRALIAGESVTLSEFGRLVSDFANQVINSRSGIVAELPELTDIQRMWALIGAQWAVLAQAANDPLAKAVGDATRALRERNATDDRAPRLALAVAA